MLYRWSRSVVIGSLLVAAIASGTAAAKPPEPQSEADHIVVGGSSSRTPSELPESDLQLLAEDLNITQEEAADRFRGQDD